MFKWALNSLERHGRKLVIMDRDGVEPYLERYYLAFPDSDQRTRKDIPFNTFLHRFMRSDDPVFHNHPFEWYHTIVLKGGYYEHTPWGTKWCGPGHTRFVRGNQHRKLYDTSPTVTRRGAVFNSIRDLVREVQGNPVLHRDLHWLEVPKPGETWTLFTRGRDHGQDWGFVPDVKTGIWWQWDVYLNMMRKTE